MVSGTLYDVSSLLKRNLNGPFLLIDYFSNFSHLRCKYSQLESKLWRTSPRQSIQVRAHFFRTLQNRTRFSDFAHVFFFVWHTELAKNEMWILCALLPVGQLKNSCTLVRCTRYNWRNKHLAITLTGKISLRFSEGWQKTKIGKENFLDLRTSLNSKMGASCPHW